MIVRANSSRRERDPRLDGVDRFVEASKLDQGDPLVVVDIRKVGIESQRSFEARERFLWPVEVYERIAPIVERLGEVRVEGERLVAARQGLLVALEGAK